MRKKLLFLLSISIGFNTVAQISNGGFENWSNSSWDVLDVVNQSQSKKSVDVHGGQAAVKLETAINGGDTTFGYFMYGNFGNGPEGGIAYNEMPDSIVGYSKYDIQPGDTALLLVIVKSGGQMIGAGTYNITGTQNNYGRFAYKIDYMMMSAVDTVFMVATSSNVINNIGVQPGSWIIYDDISFTGVNTQIPNLDFEMWNTVNVDQPDNWSTYSVNLVQGGFPDYIEKTTDMHMGNHALKITTQEINHDNKTDYAVSVSNGIKNPAQGQGQPEYIGGTPFTNQTDTLTGYYKYIPINSDSATVTVQLKNQGNNLAYVVKQLPAAGSFTYFEIPFSGNSAPDSILITLYSSSWPYTHSDSGSVVIFDDLQFKSDISVGITTLSNSNISVYPNPFQNQLTVNFNSLVAQQTAFEIYNMEGKLVHSNLFVANTGQNQMTISTTNLSQGFYHYVLKGNNEILSTGKMVK